MRRRRLPSTLCVGSGNLHKRQGFCLERWQSWSQEGDEDGHFLPLGILATFERKAPKMAIVMATFVVQAAHTAGAGKSPCRMILLVINRLTGFLYIAGQSSRLIGEGVR